MLAQIFTLIFGTAADLLALAFLARVMLQWARAPFRNPLGQFVVALTDWAALPLRRVIPGLFGVDLASIFAAWLVHIAYLGLMAGVAGLATISPVAVLDVAWLAFIAVLRTAVYLQMGVIIVMALLSWINPHSPFAPLFDTLSRPLLRPVRQRLPLLGGIDLSPLVVLVLLEVALAILANLQTLRFLSS
jgi:YggT family protein